MKTGTIVNSKQHGTGTILEINGNKAKVDFNGQIKTMLTFLLKEGKAVGNSKKKLKKLKNENGLTVGDIYSELVGTDETRNSNWKMIVPTGKIMQKADEVGSFVSEIVMNAIDGKAVTNKQAWAVAYFAKNNGLI